MRRAQSFPCPWCSHTSETRKKAQDHDTTHLKAIGKRYVMKNKQGFQYTWKANGRLKKTPSKNLSFEERVQRVFPNAIVFRGITPNLDPGGRGIGFEISQPTTLADGDPYDAVFVPGEG
ncbi:MAG TPA: hypothetical protein VFD70_05675 [Anaerolineae bacterium]|nr:hypothetical protein [Anaerolineae bacterium]